MSSSYPFTTYSGLLDPEHYKRIGSAIWLFLWCISSTTKEVERDGVVWGIVLGNKPLKLSDMSEVFGVNEKTIRRWLDCLEEHEYIRITRAPYGLILSVKNSKKFRDKERVDKNVHSQIDRTKMSTPERTDMSTLPDKNVHSNKDITKDIINTNAITKEHDDIDTIAERFKDLKTAQQGRESYIQARDYQAIARIVALGVPTSITIKLLEQCFKEYSADNDSGAIHSFKYCEKYILDKYKDITAREEVKKNPPKQMLNKHAVKKDKLPEWIEKQPKQQKTERKVTDPDKQDRIKSMLQALGEWDEDKTG